MVIEDILSQIWIVYGLTFGGKIYSCKRKRLRFKIWIVGCVEKEFTKRPERRGAVGLCQQVNGLFLGAKVIRFDDVELDEVADVVVTDEDVARATSDSRSNSKIDCGDVIFANKGRVRLLRETKVSKKTS